MFKLVVLAAFVAIAAADVAFLPQVRQQYQSQQPGQAIRILRQEQEIDPAGSYNWSYETENGISAQEEGTLRQVAPDQAGIAAQGAFKFTSPEGVPVSIQYVADENGYQPQGDAIPTSPPIPEAIARSLDWIKSHPQAPSSSNRFA